jgi:alpha-L-rhamnosidase
LDWKARWIWDGGEARPRNHYLYFRKAVRVPDFASCRAPARVCADTGYKLYVNGEYVYHGPARSDPRWQSYDTYDIGRHLRPGENVIGALVCFYGVGTCYSLVGRGGFLFECDIAADDKTVAVTTDETWKVARAPYLGGYERMSIQLPFPEDFDASQEPVGWNAPGFDDSAWENATVIGPVGMPPWTRLIPRDIPMQRYSVVWPGGQAQVYALESRVESRESKESLTPAEEMKRATRLEPAPPGCMVEKPCRMYYPEGWFARYFEPVQREVRGPDAVSVVLDFGLEVSGFVVLDIDKSGGGRVDIGYAERLEDDGSVNPDQWTGCPVHYADRLRMRPGPQRWESFHPRAFRYLRLDFHDLPKPVRFQAFPIAFGYPVEYRGVFECSDPLLNRIWEVGRYTAELCMDDGYMDCPTRERGQWLADTRVEALVAAYAFGDTKLARRAWLQYAQSQGVTDGFNGGATPPPHHHENWLRCLYPSAPPFDTVLPTFNCLWFNGLWEYFMLTGDRSLLTQVWPAAEALLQTLFAYESENRLLHNLPGWVFLDWAKPDLRGEATGVNAFYYGGLLAAAKIARAVGLPDAGGELEMRATDVKDAINDLLWDNARGVYVDCRVGDELSPVVSEQANILCILYGIADRMQTERILKAFYGKEEMGKWGNGEKEDHFPVASLPHCLSSDTIRITTPYFAFYLLRTFFSLNRHAQALAYTREKWGRMLERGATTFWEQFEPEWSLCHAWSAAPTYDLPAEIAGIRPTQPGFEEFTADIRPAGLTWFRAVVPTARGDIAVSYHYRTDKPFVDPMGAEKPLAHTEPAVTVNLTIPKGTRANVTVPMAGITRPGVLINGARVVENGAPLTPAGCPNLRIEDGNLRFSAPPGRYHVEVYRTMADNGDRVAS